MQRAMARRVTLRLMSNCLSLFSETSLYTDEPAVLTPSGTMVSSPSASALTAAFSKDSMA